MAKKMGTKANEVRAKEKGVEVQAMDFLKNLGLDWIFNGLEEEDIDRLAAKVTATDSGEWASFTHPYYRVDGNPVPGLFWGISAPLNGNVVIFRLVEGWKVMAVLKIWPSGKGILTGNETIIRALLGRKDLRPWSDDDTAALL
jgi:hypothetical protein